jgi:hypothetical protein
MHLALSSVRNSALDTFHEEGRLISLSFSTRHKTFWHYAGAASVSRYWFMTMMTIDIAQSLYGIILHRKSYSGDYAIIGIHRCMLPLKGGLWYALINPQQVCTFTLHVHISCVLMSSVLSSHWSIINTRYHHVTALVAPLNAYWFMTHFSFSVLFFSLSSTAHHSLDSPFNICSFSF